LKLVDVGKLTKIFGELQQFTGDFYHLFPEEYNKVNEIKKELKLNYFELLYLNKQVELMASTTKSNLDQPIRKLNLRKKYLDDGRLRPETDQKIWNREVMYMKNSLTDQRTKLDGIVQHLRELQAKCAKVHETLKELIKVIKMKYKKMELDRQYEFAKKYSS
jgi:hypothetical protein